MPQNPELSQRRKCDTCGKVKQNRDFYKDRNNERVNTCRDCMVRNVDVKKPSTFMPALKELDYPFVEGKWLEVCRRQYAKDPDHFDQKNVLGIYARMMKLSRWSEFGYDDQEAACALFDADKESVAEQERLAAERKEKAEKAREELRERRAAEDAERKARKEAREKAAREAKERAERERMEAEEAKIHEARRKRQEELAARQAEQETLEAIRRKQGLDENVLRDGLVGRPPKVRSDPEPPPKKRGRPPKRKDPDEAPPAPKKRGRPRKDATPEQSAIGVDTASDSLGLLSDRQLLAEKALVDRLTSDDIRQLTVKWGDTYRPSEWLRMEEMYQKYASEFELSVDREQTLRQICKVSLKLDQSIDAGEYADSAKLSAMLDNLRKSGKFTEAQNKEEKGSFVNTIGQLVEQVERIGGIIPSFKVGTDYPKDKIDITLEDNQRYLYSLVKEEAGLGNLIESYIQKLDAAEKAKKDEEKKAEGVEEEADQEEDEDYSRFLQEAVEQEAAEMFASLEE